jgi:hypothetical protein
LRKADARQRIVGVIQPEVLVDELCLRLERDTRPQRDRKAAFDRRGKISARDVGANVSI